MDKAYIVKFVNDVGGSVTQTFSFRHSMKDDLEGGFASASLIKGRSAHKARVFAKYGKRLIIQFGEPLDRPLQVGNISYMLCNMLCYLLCSRYNKIVMILILVSYSRKYASR